MQERIDERAMATDLLHGFRVGAWTVEPLKGRITAPGQESRHLQPKVMDVLVCLASHANEPVTRDELLLAVWGERAVSDEPLTRAVGELRRALDDDRSDPQYIETIPKRGYRLIGEVELEEDTGAAKPGTSMRRRRLSYVVVSLLCATVILFAWHTWRPSPPPDASIAVLPFENMSGDPDQEYFSDGMSEELLNLLARMKPLKVIARTSSFSFKGQNVDIATVAEKLNVSHVLEGSVRRSGNRVRITAQLIDAADSTHVWSQTYDREFEDIFAVQEEIAAAIGSSLQVKLALVGREVAQPAAVMSANTGAYDAYLRGRELIHRRGQKNLEEAVRHLERSLRLDNNFARAHAQLAIATLMLPGWGGSTSAETARQIALRHLDRAQELEPALAEAHGGRALLTNRSDPESSIEHAKRALVLNPSYGDALNWMSTAFTTLGRYEESDKALEQILEIDPLTMIGRHNYSWRLSELGRIEEAHQLADQLVAQNQRQGYAAHARTALFYEGQVAEGLSWALKLGGGNGLIIAALSFVGEFEEARRVSEDHWAADAHQGRWEAAIRGTQANLKQNPDRPDHILDAAHVLYLAGRIDEALPLYERSLAFVPAGRPPGTTSVSLVHAMHLALARRETGDEPGAQAAAQIVRQDHAARRAAGRENPIMDAAEAMLAAFDDDPDRAMAALRSAVQRGLRNRPYTFDDPIFAGLRNDSRFIALRQELEQILADEHEKVLQLICFNNPVPDDWQPLPETCEGVERERRP